MVAALISVDMRLVGFSKIMMSLWAGALPRGKTTPCLKVSPLLVYLRVVLVFVSNPALDRPKKLLMAGALAV